jgi:tetratricopeptide (TPR) repeat protein
VIRAALALSLLLAAPALGSPRIDLDAATALRDRDPARARELLDELVAKPREGREARDVAARASFLLGELDESSFAYAHAIERYRAVLAIDPGNWYAGAASARIAILASYGEGLDELATLDRVRRDPRASSDRVAVEALSTTPFAHPRVRAEARIFVAEAFVGRLRAPDRAIAPALEVARDPTAPEAARGAGWDLAAAALREVGDLDRARREIVDDPAAPEHLRSLIVREIRRRALGTIAAAVLALSAIAAVAALADAIRRGRLEKLRAALLRPSALVFVVVAPSVGGLLADAWEHGLGAPFFGLAVALGGGHVLSSLFRAALGDRGPGLRALSAVVATVALLSAVWFVLSRAEARGTPLLTGFGL